MAGLLFGTGGTPHSAATGSTVDGIKRIAELGLGCMEIEFVQGVRMGEASARLVAQTAARAGVRLTAHAPYFINLNARETEKVRASQTRLLQTARIGSICGVESVVFHAGVYFDAPREVVYDTIKRHLKEVVDQLKREDNRLWLRPEVMGRPSQFGNLEEALNLSSELEQVAPAIDFAHWHARSGAANSYAEFAAVLEQVERRLGKAALENMHMHISGIAYGKKGELKHLDLQEADFRYAELMRALKDYGVKGFAICESPNLEGDALLMQQTYNALPQLA
ncbi:MAG: TIM barrel protein [Chloroflexi bacterium]|nr:TIM barrel protein [Chloroflexota bacterium]